MLGSGISFLVLIGSGVVSTAVPYNPSLDSKANQYIEMAYDISRDMDFIYTLQAENDTWNPSRMSDCYYLDGVAKCGKPIPSGVIMEQSKGFCQINKPSHRDLYNNKNFLDPHRQLNACYRLFATNPNQFSGYANKSLSSRKFVWNSYMANIQLGNFADKNYIRLLKSLLK